jgi:hypothetical protein
LPAWNWWHFSEVAVMLQLPVSLVCPCPKTEQVGWSCNVFDLYMGSAQFESHQLSWLQFLWKYHKLVQNCFLPHPFLFVEHSVVWITDSGDVISMLHCMGTSSWYVKWNPHFGDSEIEQIVQKLLCGDWGEIMFLLVKIYNFLFIIQRKLAQV